MYIGSLPVSTPCTLFVQNDQGNSVRLDTSIIELESQVSIHLEVCLYEDKPISMSGFQCSLEVVYEGGFYSFVLDNVLLVRDTESTYYIAQCTKEARRKNRRGAVRVPIDSSTVLHVGARIIPDCSVRDVSGTGISFFVPKTETVNIGEKVFSAFRYRWDETLYQVKGSVVRVETPEHGSYNLIGVEFSGVYANIDKLVAEIQREKVSLHKRELLQKKI